MRLTVIGSAGSFPHPGSPASAYLLESDDGDGRTWRVLLDLGNGASGPLQAVCEPASIDLIAISHLHADHVTDMVVLSVYLRYHPAGPLGPVRVAGPSGTAARIAQIAGDDPATEVDGQFAFETWAPGTPLRVGPLVIEPVAVNHPVEAYGVRITGPAEADPDRRVVLAYTGDTDDCPQLDALADDADLLLCEAAFVEGRADAIRGVHLNGVRAGQVAARNGVGRLVLTHLSAWNDPAVSVAEARRSYAGPIDLAVPGAGYAV